MVSTLAFISEDLVRIAGTGALPSADLLPLQEAVADAKHGASRVKNIIKDLYTFSSAPREDRGDVDLGILIDRTLSIVASAVSPRAQVLREVQAPPILSANEGRLGQVLLNLVVNAAQAFPQAAPAENRILVRAGALADGRAFFDVEDNGPGISPEVLPRIFDPSSPPRNTAKGWDSGCRSATTS